MKLGWFARGAMAIPVFPSLIVSLLAAPAPSRAEGALGPDAVLAVVGGAPITVGDYLEELRRRGGASGRLETSGGRAALLEELVRAEAVHAAALEAGFEKRPDVVRDIRRMVMGRYLDEKLAPALSALSVGEDEVTAYYGEHGPELAPPRMVRGAVIWVEVPAKASDQKRVELRARAEAARAEALALPPSQLSFGSVAVTYSDDQATRYRGGDMGLLRADRPDPRWEEAVLRALFALEKPGEVGPVVTAPGGYAVVKLVEVRESEVPPLSEVRDQIGHRLLQGKKRQAEEDFYAAMRTRLKISVNRELLEKVAPPAARVPTEPPALPGNE